MRLFFRHSFGGVVLAYKWVGSMERQEDASFVVEINRQARSKLKLERELYRARPANLVERI
jgi:hypothetical protein